MYKRVADKATYTMDVVRVGDEVKAGDATFIMYRKMILFYMHLFFREVKYNFIGALVYVSWTKIIILLLETKKRNSQSFQYLVFV